MSEIKLKPCPFCGGNNIIYTDMAEDKTNTHCVYCEDCGCGTANYSGCSSHETLKSCVVKSWNRRACDTKELHAYWIPSEYGCKCSMCKKEFLAEDAAKLYECPNCKSQMGEPRKEANDA
jgi:Lar family restriction alleviation protein